eukprot:Nk52_evm29s1705 gene=Nk52_evmTU29s1705
MKQRIESESGEVPFVAATGSVASCDDVELAKINHKPGGGKSTHLKLVLIFLMIWCAISTALSVWALVKAYDYPESSASAEGNVYLDVPSGASNISIGKAVTLNDNGEPVLGGGINVKRMLNPVNETFPTYLSYTEMLPYNSSCFIESQTKGKTWVMVKCIADSSDSFVNSEPLETGIGLYFSSFVQLSEGLYILASASSLQTVRVSASEDSFPTISLGKVLNLKYYAFPQLVSLGGYSAAFVFSSIWNRKELFASLCTVDKKDFSVSVQNITFASEKMSFLGNYKVAGLNETTFVVAGPNSTDKSPVIVQVVSLELPSMKGKVVFKDEIVGSSASGFVSIKSLPTVSKPQGASIDSVALAWFDKNSNEGIKDATFDWRHDGSNSGIFSAFGTVHNGHVGSYIVNDDGYQVYKTIGLFPDNHQNSTGNRQYLVCYSPNGQNGTSLGALREVKTSGLAPLKGSPSFELSTSAPFDYGGYLPVFGGLFLEKGLFASSHMISKATTGHVTGANAVGKISNAPIGIVSAVDAHSGTAVVQTQGRQHVNGLSAVDAKRTRSNALKSGMTYYSDYDGNLVPGSIDGSDAQSASSFSSRGDFMQNGNDLMFLTKVGVALNKQQLFVDSADN